MRPEKMKEVRWLIGGGFVLDCFAVGSAFSPSPETGKAITAALVGSALIIWGLIEQRVEKRRIKQAPRRRPH